jgi:hypothetical protein
MSDISGESQRLFQLPDAMVLRSRFETFRRELPLLFRGSIYTYFLTILPPEVSGLAGSRRRLLVLRPAL